MNVKYAAQIATLTALLGGVMLTSLFFASFAFIVALTFILSGLMLLALTIARSTPRFPLEGIPFLAFGGLAVISTVWSVQPGVTLWASLEFLVTIVIAIYVPVALRPRFIVQMLFASALAIGVASIPGFLHSLSSGNPMTGIFASKNANAAEAEFWAFISTYLAFDRGSARPIRLAAQASIFVAIVFVYYSRAIGSAVSVALFFMLLAAGTSYAAVPRHLRLIVLMALLPMVIGVLLTLPDLRDGWQDFQTNVLQKDNTLTGRTFIWDTADRVSRAHPWLGVGFAAFWTHGNPYAEGIWRTFAINNRSGFNFHNVFVEYRVALGHIGLIGIILLYFYVGLHVLYNLLVRPSFFGAFIFAYLTCTYAHSFSEDGIGSAFNTATVFWIAIPRMLWVARRTSSTVARIRRPGSSGGYRIATSQD